MQNTVLAHLAARDSSLLLPRVCTTSTGESIATITAQDGTGRFVRLLNYIPGKLFAKVKPHTPALLHSLGDLLGRMDRALQDFTHPAAHRILKWDLQHASWIRDYLQCIEQPARRAIVEGFLDRFEMEVLPVLPELRTSIIHGDANDYNILVSEPVAGKPMQVVSVIDYGDMVHTYTVCELAIAVAYAMLGKADPHAAAAQVVAGYKPIAQGTPFAKIGSYEVNGGWPPHVHFQLITDLLDREGEFPGVARPGQRDIWLSLSPDPNLVTQIPAEAFPTHGLSHGQILEVRAKHVGRSLSISYRSPLNIVRSSMQYLYDENGRTYLDAVNNVCHVGHCHPRVVKAGQEQMAVLNTNTRYLHEDLVRYAERLCATLPAPLSVCYFVCSGSEANELALRLARTHTGCKDIVVVDAAYHGNTTALVEISPYKFDGLGGTGAPPYIHMVTMPDVYRGEYKRSDPQAGEKYARHTAEAILHLQQKGDNIAAIICESLLVLRRADRAAR